MKKHSEFREKNASVQIALLLIADTYRDSVRNGGDFAVACHMQSTLQIRSILHLHLRDYRLHFRSGYENHAVLHHNTAKNLGLPLILNGCLLGCSSKFGIQLRRLIIPHIPVKLIAANAVSHFRTQDDRCAGFCGGFRCGKSFHALI